MDTSIHVIISVLGLTAIMFAPVVAILLLPNIEKSYPRNRHDGSLKE
ncbi:hypothetical protein [Brevibacterium yomogidense]|nr:hypothetical protein [Brevibacterium yomogidense]